MFDLSGKVALVTGAGRGIGKEIALALARSGADVAVSDIADAVFETAKEIQAKCANVNAFAAKCDVSNFAQAETAKNQLLSKLGRVDLLINNAGIYPQKPFVEMTQEDWDKVIQVNLNGVFHCTKVFLPGMVERKYGKIVNLSSISGPVVAFPNLVHYSASKGAISGFTRALALEMAGHGINVNAVAPGPIDVGGAEANQSMYEQVIRAIPMGHMGKPSDVAALVLFLVSDEANFITGQTIVTDGGYTLQ
ncbi:MAG: SDR family oxidoreductase [Candidatus Bathyarchaeota archaeon]|nr:SDR family oxidoreductase [Candidatus Bathyarchaeota archaeon]